MPLHDAWSIHDEPYRVKGRPIMPAHVGFSLAPDCVCGNLHLMFSYEGLQRHLGRVRKLKTGIESCGRG